MISMGEKMKTIEEQIKELKFGESVRLESGVLYTRTFGGWIYSNFSGSAICFIPDNEPKEKVKAEETEKKGKNAK